MVVQKRFAVLLLLFAALACSLGIVESTISPLAQNPWGITSRLSQCLAGVRGGSSSPQATTGADIAVASDSGEKENKKVDDDQLSLDEKVKKAMKRLGLSGDSLSGKEDEECKDGVCPMPKSVKKDSQAQENDPSAPTKIEEDPHVVAQRIGDDLGIDKSWAMAALGATGKVELGGTERKLDETAARELIQHELNAMKKITEDCDEVKQLVSEGHDVSLSRRALAFSEMNLDGARAILIADERDAEEEERILQAKENTATASPATPQPEEEDPEAEVLAGLRKEAKDTDNQISGFRTITVDSDFDPTAVNDPTTGQPSNPTMPPPAKKSDVVFDATAAEVQELVLESPVPVLVDVYADWCGPCKALTPALEDMAIKGGGAFRLVKINSDNEKAIAGALEVRALPTVFGVRDGKILNGFEGMPRSEEMMKNFMMALMMPGTPFKPPLTADEKARYAELTSKLLKTASAAGFSFAARERLQNRMATQLRELVEAHNGNMLDAEESAKVARSLFSNIIRNPTEPKFRKVNLQNKVIAAKLAAFSPCITILKAVGFEMDPGGGSMTLGKDKKVVNVASLAVARESIDKWIDKNRHALAVAARKRQDELDRAKLEAEGALEDDDDEEEEEEEEVDPNRVVLKVRLEGKKKVHEVALDANSPLKSVLSRVSVDHAEEEYQIVCASKKLLVKSGDESALNQSLREHSLFPSASLVIKVASPEKEGSVGSSLQERASAQKSKKKGSHTMQSVGIYAKDDNAKGELIDGGAGALYEHDVTDDEDEEADPQEEEDPKEESE